MTTQIGLGDMNEKYIAEQGKSDLEQANEANVILTNQLVKLHDMLLTKEAIVVSLERENEQLSEDISDAEAKAAHYRIKYHDCLNDFNKFKG